jgi:hypothetical protein
MKEVKISNGEATVQSETIKKIKNAFNRFIEEYRNQKNLYKVAEIATAVGIGGFLAYKFIPWEKVVDKFEKNFNEVFGEFEFNPSEAEGSI